MLKWWRLAFNLDSEYFQFLHIWVFFLGLPLQFWNEYDLVAIGNSLGTFISLGENLLSTSCRNIGKIFVEMDVHGGLP